MSLKDLIRIWEIAWQKLFNSCSGADPTNIHECTEEYVVNTDHTSEILRRPSRSVLHTWCCTAGELSGLVQLLQNCTPTLTTSTASGAQERDNYYSTVGRAAAGGGAPSD